MIKCYTDNILAFVLLKIFSTVGELHDRIFGAERVKLHNLDYYLIHVPVLLSMAMIGKILLLLLLNSYLIYSAVCIINWCICMLSFKGFYSQMSVKNIVLEHICGHFYFSRFPKVITLSKFKKNSKFGVT